MPKERFRKALRDKPIATGVQYMAMKNSDDSELVAQYRGGNSDAFAELVRRNQDAVFNLAWRMTGNWHEAADIAQETFIRAYQKLYSYKTEFAFKNWLLAICANLTRNHLRSSSRRKQRELAMADAQDFSPPRATTRDDDDLELAIARLPELLRLALILKHLEGMSYADVARTLGVGISAAKMRVARGRDELARLLDHDRGASE